MSNMDLCGGSRVGQTGAVADKGIWSLSFCLLVGLNALTSGAAFAQSARPDWRTGPNVPAKTAEPAPSRWRVKTDAAPKPPQNPSPKPKPPPVIETSTIDQSVEVLNVDFALAASIASLGPKDGYASSLSEEGILYDASGTSPIGAAAADMRFSSFPTDVVLERTPEKALAAGGSGSSWGGYAIKRGDTVLSSGRYVSVWRREPTGWKMIAELAAGRTIAATPADIGPLPKRPAPLGQAAPKPVGQPLAVPSKPMPPPVQIEPDRAANAPLR